MNLGTNEAFVVTDRGGIIENRHIIHIAVVDSSSGRLLYHAGNPERMTLVRSAVKPVQALAILETGVAARYGFDDADIALMAASHNSEDHHIQRARAMLAKADLDESHLQCGPHPAIIAQVGQDWIQRSVTPTAIHNNCSGKHAGMMAGAKELGDNPATYHLPSNLMQEKFKATFEELCGQGRRIRWAVDGCNLPAPACALSDLARVFSQFAEAQSIVERTPAHASDRTRLQARVFEAMVRHPENVAGLERFCTELMRQYNGQLIGKIGADACYGIGIKPSEQTRSLGAEGAVGIAIKVEDGNLDVCYSVALEVLRQLGFDLPARSELLTKFARGNVYNTAGVVVGSLTHCYSLEQA